MTKPHKIPKPRIPRGSIDFLPIILAASVIIWTAVILTLYIIYN